MKFEFQVWSIWPMWLFTNNEKTEDKKGRKFIKVGKFRGMEDNIFLYIKLEAPRIYPNRVILQIHEYVVKILLPETIRTGLLLVIWIKWESTHHGTYAQWDSLNIVY